MNERAKDILAVIGSVALVFAAITATVEVFGADVTFTDEELAAIGQAAPPGPPGMQGVAGPPGPIGPAGPSGSGVHFDNGICSADIGEASYVWACVVIGDPVPPVDPPPVDPPPVDPPDDGPLVTFGPVQAIVSYPNTISALAQDFFRWEITFTLNSVISKVSGTPRSATVQGLASRDESGQAQSGHLSVWVEDSATGGQRIIVRHQDISGGHASTQLQSTTIIEPNVEYQVTVSIAKGVNVGLFVNGALEASNPWAIGTSGNDLPLIVGGLCTTCKRPPPSTVGPSKQIDGTVYMEIWDDPLDLPTPITGIATIQWILPTEDTDNEPLAPGALVAVHIYAVNGQTNLIDTVAGDRTTYVANDLPEGEHCFQVTARNGGGESAFSNRSCMVVQ